jgi:hypothetical protein
MRTQRMFILAGLVALVMVAIVSTARGQNESGFRSLTKEAWQKMGYWYDSSTARYHIGYPIIRSLPPLSSNMPLDILLAYIHMDSLARFDFNNTAEERLNQLRQEYNFTDPPHRFSDTLKQAAAFLYRLVDYNPILFNQYIDEVTLKYRSRYRANLPLIATRTSIVLYEGLTDADRRVANVALLEADYILRVRVQSVDSMEAPTDPGIYYYRATADVLDILKGRVLPPSCSQSFNVRDGEKGRDSRSVLSASSCIQFMYFAHLFSDPRHGPSGGPRLFYARDPEFARGPDSLFALKPGQEAVIFLKHNDILRDSTHDWYHLKLERRASMGVLPVINGQVRDINRIWSDDVMLDYTEWRRRLMALRDRLLNGTY